MEKQNFDGRFKYSSCWGHGTHEHWNDILQTFLKLKRY